MIAKKRVAILISGRGSNMGALIAAAVLLLDPEVVVIGGGVSNAGEALLVPLRAAAGRQVLESHRRSVRIVGAALGEQAGVAGAGLAAWEAAGSGPG